MAWLGLWTLGWGDSIAAAVELQAKGHLALELQYRPIGVLEDVVAFGR